MISILRYSIYFTPNGNGEIVFLLQDEPTERTTGFISPQAIAAAAAVLSLKNIAYNLQTGMFAGHS